jgi:TrmH family RNA methyltransferase
MNDVDMTGRIAIVLGNEGWGIAEEAEALIDRSVRIPMPGPAESLNVGIAGSILLFEAVRQRRLSSAHNE